MRALGMSTATDHMIMDVASTEAQVVVSADTDFGELLSRTNTASPSVLLLRRQDQRRAAQVADLLMLNLPMVAADLKPARSLCSTMTACGCAACRCARWTDRPPATMRRNRARKWVQSFGFPAPVVEHWPGSGTPVIRRFDATLHLPAGVAAAVSASDGLAAPRQAPIVLASTSRRSRSGAGRATGSRGCRDDLIGDGQCEGHDRHLWVYLGAARQHRCVRHPYAGGTAEAAPFVHR